MNTQRTDYRQLIVIGAALVVAAVLAATGTHGFWWLFGLAWAFGLFGGPRRVHGTRGWHGRHGCGSARRSEQIDPGTETSTSTGPDPSRDRHTAFPATR